MNRKTSPLALLAGACVLLAVSCAAPAGEGAGGAGTAAVETASWTGWITDASCGAANANAEGKACSLDCYKRGSKLVLYVDADETLIGLDDQEAAVAHLGHPVVVTGVLEDGVIRVASISKKES